MVALRLGKVKHFPFRLQQMIKKKQISTGMQSLEMVVKRVNAGGAKIAGEYLGKLHHSL